MGRLWCVRLSLAAGVMGCQREASDPGPHPPQPSKTGATSSSRLDVPAASCDRRETCDAACRQCETTCPAHAAAACHALGELYLRGERIELTLAADAYRRACEGGHLISCASLGLQVQDGRGVAREPARAVALYEQACGGGIGVGCFNLGLMHAAGNGVDIDEPRAEQNFEKARIAYEKQCSAGELAWCMNLGVLYERGYGVAKDQQRAAAIYRQACGKGHGESCVNQALQDIESGQVDRGVGLLRRTCEGGDRLACSALGHHHVKGAPGSPPDPARGEPLLVKACREGVRHACGVLGAVVGSKATSAEDRRRADALEERACDLGGSVACLILGEQQLDANNPSRAAHYFERACWIGAAQACGTLGALYDRGLGVSQNDSRALALLKAACRLGDPGSCVVLIDRDEPLPLPPDKQRQIVDGACQRGNAKACAALRRP